MRTAFLVSMVIIGSNIGLVVGCQAGLSRAIASGDTYGLIFMLYGPLFSVIGVIIGCFLAWILASIVLRFVFGESEESSSQIITEEKLHLHTRNYRRSQLMERDGTYEECRNCGNILAKGTSFCTECGNNLS